MANAPNSTPQALIQHLAQQLTLGPKADTYLVAYSAGADSTALLHALTQLDIPQPIYALHVNHGLQAQADSWAQLAQSNCSAWNVPLSVERVTVTANKQGLEAAARAARYAAITQHSSAGTVVLMAHHHNDQAETLLLNLLRGSGIRGLAGIPETRQLADASIYRPLLELPGEQLRNYCKQQQLDFIEDASNNDLRFDRNWLRHELLPFIQTRFNQADSNLGTSADLLRQALQVNQHYTQQLLTPMLDDKLSLDLQRLKQQPDFLQHELLRSWIRNQQHSLPSRQRLTEFIRQINTAQADKAPELCWDSHCLRVYQQQLSLQQSADQAPLKETRWQPPTCFIWPGVGELKIEQAKHNKPIYWPIFTVTQRHGGEAILLDDGHHHTLKKLCQQAAIPPWQRAELPLFYHRGQLMAVADRWLHPALTRWLQQQGIGWQWQTVK